MAEQAARGRELLKRLVSNQMFFLILLIVVMGTIATIFNPRFFTVRNILNVLNQNAVTAIVAAGATLVMISGNFDISVGSMIGLATTTSALLVVDGMAIAPAMVIGFFVCVVCGLFNGLIIAKTRTPSFIITLAMLSTYHGISLITTGGITKSLAGKFAVLGRGVSFGAIPNPILVCLGVFLFLWALLRFTKLGRRVYAVGGNEEAAYLSGVNADLTKIIVYGLNGVLVGIGSIVLLSRLGSALPSTGSGMELRAIAAVVIGGVPLSGGKGNALGTFLGVILMGLISNVLNLLNISAYYQEVAIGIIISVAVIFSNLGRMRRK
ncbi:MAG: ABC transporter permease [Spirochaetales bacterium]|nr:ABC transporter permease [Spirochaetales bacterium]